MNDEERADWLARAIDDMLSSSRQRPKEPPPPELERDELNALMRIAGERIESGQTRLQSGLQYEGEVWQGVLHKLDRRRRPRKVRTSGADAAPLEDQLAAEHRLEQMEIDELRSIAKMRRELAEDAASIAETHRDEVWQRVVSRLHEPPEPRPKKRSRFPFFWRNPDKNPPGSALDCIGSGGLEPGPGDEVEGLVEIVRTRSYWSQLAKKAARDREERVWTRVSRTLLDNSSSPARPEALVGRAEQDAPASGGTWWPKLVFATIIIGLVYLALGKRDKRGGREKRTAVGGWWPRMAAAAVILAVAVAALGPLPATGFADHPFAAFGRSVAEHVGVRETPAPPTIGSEEPVVFAGREVTVAEASVLLGAAVRVPPAPQGFALRASRYFDAALTADEGGTYALTYAGPEQASVVVYQERASGGDLAAGEGAAIDVALKDGTAATYVKGAWQATGEALTWSAGAGQTLVFERAGLRITLQYTGPEADAPSLFALAQSMAPAQ
jgi:hypothetical protein